MAYINYRENNLLYSPGLSTYTSHAEKGDIGQSGLSVYYNDGIITDNKSEEDRVVQNILSGSILSSSDASGDSISYKTGDIIIDGNADVYRIDLESADKTLKYIGNIRQSIGKVYTAVEVEGEISYSIIQDFSQISGIDNLQMITLDEEYNPSTTNITYIKLINTATGEVAVFDAQ